MNEASDADAIRRERDLFRLAQRAGSIGLWYSDPGDQGKLIWTEETYRIFGLTKDTFDGTVETFFKAVHPDDLLAVRTASQNALDPLQRAPYLIEHRIIRPSGEVRWVHQEGQVIWGVDGTAAQFIGITQDITERHEAQIRLRASEERFRTLFEVAGDGIFLMDGDTFVACNQKTLEIFGCPRERIIGGHPYELSPATQPDGRASKDAALEKIAAALRGELQRFPWRHVRCDGREFDAEVTLTRVELEGKPYLQAIVRDRTEEIALQRQQKRLVSIIENTPEYIGTATPNGKTVYLNDAFRRILAPEWKERAEEPGIVPISVFHSPEAAKLIMETGIPTAVKHGIWQGESALLDARGRPFPVLQTIVAHPDATGELEFLSIICRDIEGLKAAQQKIEESERRFRTLVENSSEGIMTISADGKVLYESPATARICGRPAENRIGTPADEFVHPDDTSAFRAWFARLKTSPGTILPIQVRNQRADGNWQWLDIAGISRLDDPTIGAVIANFRDITQQKEAEEKRVLSEVKFSSFAEQAPMAIQLFRPDGLCTYANPAWQKFWESDTAEAVMHYNVREDPQAKERGISELVERAFKGEAVEIPAFYYDPKLNGKKGRPRWVRTHFYAIRTTTGDIAEVALIGEDVTEQHEAQQEIESSERRFRLLFSNISDVIYTVAVESDGQYRFSDVNAAFLGATGLPADRVVGQLVTDVIPPASQSLVLENYARAIRERKTVQWEEKSEYPSGTKYGEVSVTPVFDAQDRCTMLIGTVHDISTLMAARAAESRAVELERLNKLLIGRELKMVELKAELDALKAKEQH